MLPDVNVLVYAHREDSPHHAGCRDWLEELVNGDASYGLSELVLSSVVRVVTHPKVFNKPSPLADAISASKCCKLLIINNKYNYLSVNPQYYPQRKPCSKTPLTRGNA